MKFIFCQLRLYKLHWIFDADNSTNRAGLRFNNIIIYIIIVFDNHRSNYYSTNKYSYTF